MDSATPPQPVSPYYATTDFYARNEREKQLCETASTWDIPYVLMWTAGTVGAVVLDTLGKKADQETADQQFRDGKPVTGSPIKMVTPIGVGLTWGGLVGSIWPSAPKCQKHWVSSSPPEGNIRESWPIVVVFAVLAGATAPVLEGIVTGVLPPYWTTDERSLRLLTAGLTAFGAAFIPYIPFLAPRPWNAGRQLERIRARVSGEGAYVSYTLSF